MRSATSSGQFRPCQHRAKHGGMYLSNRTRRQQSPAGQRVPRADLWFTGQTSSCLDCADCQLRRRTLGSPVQSSPNGQHSMSSCRQPRRYGRRSSESRRISCGAELFGLGRVEDGRGSLGPMASAPFPIPAHQTERADFRHSAFRLASPQGPRWSAALCWCPAMTPRHVTYLRLAI